MESNVDKELLELTEMREQMQMLRNDLDQQIHVNGELMISQLKKNSVIIRTDGLTALILGILGAYPIIVYSHMYGLSKACTIASIAFLLIDGVYSFIVTHMVKDKNISEGNTGEILSKMLKVKKITRAGTSVEVLTVILMVIWIFCETFWGPRFHYFADDSKTRVIIAFACGTVLGLLVAIMMYRRHTKAINEMVETLNGRLR